VLSETRLQQVIDQWDLYPQLRRTSAREAVIEQMRSDVEINVKQSGGGLAVFSITYQGKDPAIVAKVTNKLASDFIPGVSRAGATCCWNNGILEFAIARSEEGTREQEDKVRQYKMSHLGELPQQQEALLHTLSSLQAELQANGGNLSRSMRNG